jgi:hypothetical protein
MQSPQLFHKYLFTHFFDITTLYKIPSATFVTSETNETNETNGKHSSSITLLTSEIFHPSPVISVTVPQENLCYGYCVEIMICQKLSKYAYSQ